MTDLAAHQGVLDHRGEQHPVTVQFAFGCGPTSEEPAGHLDFAGALRVGSAVTLRLDDGRRGLIVIVDRHQRFIAAGPIA